jgi:hypothetical protein
MTNAALTRDRSQRFRRLRQGFHFLIGCVQHRCRGPASSPARWVLGGRSNGRIASRETVRVSFVQHVSGNSTRSDEFRYFIIAGFLNGF